MKNRWYLLNSRKSSISEWGFLPKRRTSEFHRLINSSYNIARVVHQYSRKLRRKLFIFESLRDKTSKMTVLPVKTQICLGIRPVWSESSLCAQWVAKDPSFLQAGSEDTDQTGRMPRLIWVFAGRTCHFVGFVMRWLTFWYQIVVIG